MTDSVEGAAEVKPKDCERDVVLDGKVSDVLDCSGGQLDSSVGSVAVLLFINNISGGILEPLSDDARYDLVGDLEEADGTDRANLISWFVRFRNANDLP